MNKRQFILTLIFTIIFAFIGGALSTQLFLGYSVFAQGEEKIIIAEEFRLVDRERITRAVLKTFNNPQEKTIFEMLDREGKRRILFVIEGDGNPSLHFWDKNADEKYKPVNHPSVSFWEDSAKLRARIPVISETTDLNRKK